MAYRNEEGNIVSGKAKKAPSIKKTKSRVGQIVWWISKDLNLKVGKIVGENPTTFSVVLKGEDNKVEEVLFNLVRDGNDDDYYV